MAGNHLAPFRLRADSTPCRVGCRRRWQSVYSETRLPPAGTTGSTSELVNTQPTDKEPVPEPAQLVAHPPQGLGFPVRARRSRSVCLGSVEPSLGPLGLNACVPSPEVACWPWNASSLQAGPLLPACCDHPSGSLCPSVPLWDAMRGTGFLEVIKKLLLE